MKGVIARMAKDDAEARTAFGAARAEQEKLPQTPQSYGPALCVLGLIDAALGRKEEAARKAGVQSSFFRWKRIQLAEPLWSNTAR